MTLRRVAIILIALQCFGLSPSYAATAKPTPKPLHKVTIIRKAIPKKKTLSKKVSVSKKAVVAKKKMVHHYIYHKPVLKPVPPSPSPSWPPHGFATYGSAYARIPTGAELIGILSKEKKPAATINSCAKDPKHPTTAAHSCAAILVASTEKCTWWEITSIIKGIDPANPSVRIALGNITTYAIGAAAKKVQTIFLVSPIPLQIGIKFTAIHALCGKGPPTEPVPSTTFTPTSIAPIASTSSTESAISPPTPMPAP